jgi:hypothetical protein
MSDTATVEEQTVGTIVLTQEQLTALMDAAAKKAADQVKADMLGGNAPPKTMRAKVSDGFIKGRSGGGARLKHYRVDGVLAMKIAEIDMDRLEYYQGDGADELPLDSSGYPRSARTMAHKRGHWITIANGDIYPTSENQVRQLEWMKALPSDTEGGLPGLYEVTGAEETWTCHTCRPARPFPNKITWERHRLATHGIQPDEEAEAA